MDTTHTGINRANEILGGDWDAAGTISAHLPIHEAHDLLAARGWVRTDDGHGWQSPTGHHYWHTSEALQVALVAEVAPPPESEAAKS